MSEHRVCPRCNGVAKSVSPVKKPTQAHQIVYGCPACGLCFNHEMKPVLDRPEQLRDIFRGATKGHETVLGILKAVGSSSGKKTKGNAASMVLAETKMLEYGVQMWFDGLKQGLLLGTIETMKEMDDGEAGS